MIPCRAFFREISPQKKLGGENAGILKKAAKFFPSLTLLLQLSTAEIQFCYRPMVMYPITKKEITMKLKIFTGLSMLLSAAVFGAACGRGHFHHREVTEDHINRVSERIADKLDMNDVQKEKMKRLSEKIAAKLPVMKRHRSEMSDMVSRQFSSDTFNRSEVEESMKSHQDQMKEMHSFIAASMEEFHGILTPEQRKKVIDFMEKNRDKHGHGTF